MGRLGRTGSRLTAVPDTNHQEGQPGLFAAAFFGLCPDCGEKSLFASVSRFSDKCPKCGLDYESYNVGDGPAAFMTMGVGAIIIILAILFENAVRPPFWVHAVIWIPVTVALTVLSLRLAKGMLLITEHRRSAREAKGDEIK